MNKIQKYTLYIIFVILAVSTILCISLYFLQSQELQDLKQYKLDTQILNTDYEKICPICGQEVTLKRTKTHEYWYIECNTNIYNDGCGLRTGFYKDPIELIYNWNNMSLGGN